MTAPHVLWEDLDWQRNPEWADLYSANVVSFPGSHMDSSFILEWDEDLVVICGMILPLKPLSSLGEIGDILVPLPGVSREDHMHLLIQ